MTPTTTTTTTTMAALTSDATDHGRFHRHGGIDCRADPTPVPTAKPDPTPTPTPKPTATPTPTPIPTPTPTPTSAPTATPTATPTANPATPPPVPTPTPTPTAQPTATSVPTPTPPSGSVRVTSIAGLTAALADDSNTDIVVANGTYHVGIAYNQASDSLYIGSRFAGRTRPVTVRAETIGGVTFDGGGGTSYMGMAFEQGAHDQTWDGFNFANMVGTPIEFGGFTPSAPAHHITLRHITLKSTCLRASASSNQEQGIYFSNAAGSGPHDILLEDVTVDGTNPNSVWSAIHAYHGDPADPPASRVTIRRLTVTGTTNGIVLWNDTAIQHDWLIEDSTISGARDTAIRFESIGAQNIVFDAITSSGSGTRGFYSSMGSNPPGVTFVDDSLH